MIDQPSPLLPRLLTTILAAAILALLPQLSTRADDELKTRVGDQIARAGDEIMVCGQLFHTTARTQKVAQRRE